MEYTFQKDKVLSWYQGKTQKGNSVYFLVILLTF